MKWINRLYMLFLGIILSITTGFGIAAFYPQPIPPLDTSTLYSSVVPKSCYSTPEAEKSTECQKAFDKAQAQEEANNVKRESEMRAFESKNAGYSRTAIFFGIVIGAIFAISGIALIKISRLVATGLLLAGVLTAILTRLLIMLASLGAPTTSSTKGDLVAYVEFAVLLILSILVVFVGLHTLKEEPVKK